MHKFLTFAVLVLFCASETLAWSQAGHKIIASIAFRRLTGPEQAKVITILKKHPRFTADFADEMPADIAAADETTRNEWLFQQAAIWPDEVRPPGPAAKTAFHRGEWHYINLPHFLNDASRATMEGTIEVNLQMDPPDTATLDTEKMNAIQVIRWARKVCADTTVDNQTRAVLLAWLFHDVGDIHQPLHSTAMFSTRLFAAGDRGGNRITTLQSENLHSLWDHFPGGEVQFNTAKNRAVAALADAELAALGDKAEKVLQEKEWLQERHLLAVVAAYDPELMVALRKMEKGTDGIEQVTLSEDYLNAGGRISDRRVVQAGFRLGAVLKKIVAE